MCCQETLTFPDRSESGNPEFQVSAHIKWQLPEKSSLHHAPTPGTFPLVKAHLFGWSCSVFPGKTVRSMRLGARSVFLTIAVPGLCISRTWYSAWPLESFNKYLLDIEYNDDDCHLTKQLLAVYSELAVF